MRILKDMHHSLFDNIPLSLYPIVTQQQLLHDNNITTYKYKNPEIIDINRSSVTSHTGNHIEQALGEHEIPENIISEIPGGTIIPGVGDFTPTAELICRHNMAVNKQSIKRRLVNGIQPDGYFNYFCDLANILYNGDCERLIQSEVIKLPLAFSIRGKQSYFHWVTEAIPTIRGLRMIEKRINTDIPIILDPDPPDYVYEYLELFNISRAQIVEVKNKPIVVERLFLPSYNSIFRVRSKTDINWIRGELNCMLQHKGNTPDKIYISRKSDESRYIKNEENLYRKLSKLGFKKYNLSCMSVKNQIELFSNADYVVGAHGAGLTNVIYSTDSFLYEIRPEDMGHRLYYSLINILGSDYEFTTVADMGRNDSFSVDVEQIHNDLISIMN